MVHQAGQEVAAQAEDGVLKAAGALAGAGYVLDEVEPPSIAWPPGPPWRCSPSVQPPASS
ncbi:MAG TPA: hypothetical protein VFW50_17965 [Streptosporangiaceae bacterium]|nr:hypothetical protein [Streptosporangiaceae bacterium]